ncbi:hypothetical protein CR513_13469, partial [Mucuna pruriens]
MSMIQQLKEMREIIHKLNNELIAKEVKEKSLKEKMVQLMHNHEKQSEQMQQQNQQIQLILHHLQLKSLVSHPTLLNTNEDRDDYAYDDYLQHAVKDDIDNAYDDYVDIHFASQNQELLNPKEAPWPIRSCPGQTNSFPAKPNFRAQVTPEKHLGKACVARNPARVYKGAQVLVKSVVEFRSSIVSHTLHTSYALASFLGSAQCFSTASCRSKRAKEGCVGSHNGHSRSSYSSKEERQERHERHRRKERCERRYKREDGKDYLALGNVKYLDLWEIDSRSVEEYHKEMELTLLRAQIREREKATIA